MNAKFFKKCEQNHVYIFSLTQNKSERGFGPKPEIGIFCFVFLEFR